jgi:hypothetical protein
MEGISIHNYEIWFTDFLDGLLDESQLSQLLDFLEEHPDLKSELEGLSGVNLVASGEIFPAKESLMKTSGDIPGISSEDQLCIARMENDLPDEKQKEFDARILRDPGLKSLYGQYLGTRLPKERIVFGYKSSLIHKKRVLTPWILTAVSSAALIILGLLLWPRESEPAQDMASGNTPSRESVITTPEQTVIPATKPASREIRMASVTRINHEPVETVETSQPETGQQSVQREFVPMNSLAHKSAEMFPMSIPDPGDNPVIFASVFLRSVETTVVEDNFLTLPQYALQLFREKVLGEERSFVKRTRFSVWEVAGAGINRINQIAGTEMKLDREYGTDGQVMAVSFNSRLLDFETPVRTLAEKEQ